MSAASVRPARRSTLLALACAVGALTVAGVPDAGATTPAQDAGRATEAPRVATLVRNVRTFYGGLERFSVTMQVDYAVPSLGVEDLFDVRVVAERPNRIAVRTNVRYYTTNEFISDGRTLFEWQKRRERWAANPAPADFDAMRARLENHRMVNAPVDLAVALLSSDPVPAMLQIAREPGALTIVGEEDVRGVRCAHLRVGTDGAEAWVALDGKPWVMRYRPTPSLLDPRVLPEGIELKGPTSTFDFIDWRTTEATPGAFEWTEPEGVERLPTLHEPIDGVVAQGDADRPVARDGSTPTLTRAGDEAAREAPARALVGVGETLPDLAFLDRTGEVTSLSDRIGDHDYAVVLVWASWSKLSNAWAQQSRRLVRDERVVLVPVAHEQSVRVADAWVRRRGVLDRTLVDPEGIARDGWGVADVPVVLVIDRDRTIRRRVTDYSRTEVDRLARYIADLVAEDGGDDADGDRD